MPSTVYYVSTPIGNLEDITLRAIRTLREVDVIASEDTRVTSALLSHLGVGKKRLLAHHDHNLESSVPKLLALLESGSSVAVVTDAGTPGISDPGLALAAACVARGVPLVPVPGPCAAVAALSVAGIPAGEFVFSGFIPRGSKSRRAKISELSEELRAVVLYEAPHRMTETLGDLSAAGCGERAVVCCRELTKLHEEFHRGTIASAYEWYKGVAARDGRVRGEFTIILGPADEGVRRRKSDDAAAAAEAAASAEVAARLAAGGSLSRVAKDVAAEFGVPKSRVYAEALRQREEGKQQRRQQRERTGNPKGDPD